MPVSANDVFMLTSVASIIQMYVGVLSAHITSHYNLYLMVTQNTKSTTEVILHIFTFEIQQRSLPKYAPL